MNHLSNLNLVSNQQERILVSAALFENEFSIDWIQSLLNAKATEILKTLDQYGRSGILKKLDIGIFCFADGHYKQQLRKSLPTEERKARHKQIADLLINEIADKDKAVNAAAEQLLHIQNDLEGCRLLRKAGDYYRRIGESSKSKVFYEKALMDLDIISGKESDLLIINIMIGFSKDHMASSRPKTVISYLNEALKRAKKMNDPLLVSLVLLHLSSHQYMAGDYTSASKNYLQGRSIAKDIRDPSQERNLITSAVIHNNYTGHFKEAVRDYDYFDPVFSKQPSLKRFSVKVELILAVTCAIIGRISQGLGILGRIRTEAHNAKDYVVEAPALASIGLVFIYMNDFENAIATLNEAMRVRRRNDLSTEHYTSLPLAYCYYRTGNTQKSQGYLQIYLKLRQRYAYNVPNILFELCLAIEQGHYPPIAGLSFDDELKKALQMENMYTQGIAYRYMAIRQVFRHEPYDMIRHNLEKSLMLLEASGAQMELAETKIELARSYLQQDNQLEAKKYALEAAQALRSYGDRSVPDDLKNSVGEVPVQRNIENEILKLGAEVVSLRDIKEVVQHILITINRITGAERGAIFIKAGNNPATPVEFWAGKNLSVDDLTKPEFVHSNKIIKHVFESGQGCVSGEPLPEQKFAQDRQGIVSTICMPLTLRGKIIGVLYHDNRLFSSMFDLRDLQTLSYFTSLAAIAIDNAQAYDEIKKLNQTLNDEKQYLEDQQLNIKIQEGLIAESPVIKQVLSSAIRVAQTESTVLILGETGVGKEMIARAVHQNSPRKHKPFIKVHCGALPEGLITSELFGHEKGAFTGAFEKRIGRFELADGGTLFLDEIGEISMDVQIRLLRVLQTREFERVGGLKTIQSDFRLITATNRNLEADVSSGRFREDLFYRLNVFPIHVPPLRERVEDIEALAVYFLEFYSGKMCKAFKGISKDEMIKLKAYHWPGNIRELKNVIERGVILNIGGLFRVPEMLKDSGTKLPADQITLEEMERRFILQTIQKSQGKIYGPGGAAEMLGLNHSTLYSRMKKLGIRKPSAN